ncbi:MULTISPECIES: hypothetical protein [unclassified Streptomyces]|uniref:hypothetical protein n=1 Tax=Streptomyces sp. NRRL F-4428 TaxID=1609137 RepID=UPI00061F23EB|nr:hypothetical protein [Streptomyces sp. NRRL F-4428]KJK51981.1 hypothetical protein UK14_10015 [Streptomyces sp. NRRL F-4428]
MISEPELDGAWEPARPAGTARAEAVPGEAAQEGAAQEGADRPRRPFGSWWGVAAAVVATSALWAGGLYAFGERLAAPEVRYAVTDDLCGRYKAPALATALGGTRDSERRKAERHPVLDWASCNHHGKSADGSGGYTLVAMVELHKKTDPKPEFALGSSYERAFGDDLTWEEVPGLGEQALVGTSELGDGVRLRVRDGGAVFTFTLMFYDLTSDPSDPEAAPPSRPDPETLTAAAVEDMRALMAALRKD